MSEVVEFLQKMKDDLFENGWHQGSYYRGLLPGQKASRRVPAEVPACLIGSAYRVSDAVPGFSFSFTAVQSRAVQAMRSILRKRDPITLGRIDRWNDAPGRTFDEVIELIDETILAVKQRESEE